MPVEPVPKLDAIVATPVPWITTCTASVVAVQPLTESGVFTSGTTDAVQVSIQGTGAATMASNFGTGSTGITATLIADFDQTPA